MHATEFDEWRAAQSRRRRIPEPFWVRAAELAGELGVSKVSTALRISFEDLFMSLIHTCELNGVNPFDYLVALQQQTVTDLKANASLWMPWNYKDDRSMADAVASLEK